jgi:hypothetical protein
VIGDETVSVKCGEILTIDGSSGRIYCGEMATIPAGMRFMTFQVIIAFRQDMMKVTR